MPTVIDVHLHIEGGNYPPVSSWVADADELGVEAAVLVQNLGNGDNAPLLAAVHEDARRFAAIVIPATPSDASALLDDGAVGIRIGADGLHSHPGDRLALEALAQRSAIASVHDNANAVIDPAFRQLIIDFPEVIFRLEHVGCLPHSSPASARSAVMRLGELPNVHMVWSGFFHFSDRNLPYTDAWPALRESLEVFTPERISWSGDWNRAGGTRDIYRQELDLLDQLPFVTAEARDAIAHRTARLVYWKEAP